MYSMKRCLYGILQTRTCYDIVPEHLDVVVSIVSTLLVPESDRVTELVHHHVLVLAAVADRQATPGSYTVAHMTPATGPNKY